MNYTINEIKHIAEKLHLNDVVDTCQCAIEGMAGVGNNFMVLVLTTHNAIAKAFFKEFLCLSPSQTSMFRISPCEINIESGEKVNYTIETELGMINVDEDVFVAQLYGKNDKIVHASTKSPTVCCENMDIKFLFLDDFSNLSYNEWIMKLSSVDKLYYILDGLQVFNDKEKLFIDEVINKLFSIKRKSIVIGNSQHLNIQEKKEILEYINSLVEPNTQVLMSDDDKCSLSVLNDDISCLRENALESRRLLELEVATFAKTLLIERLPNLKQELLTKDFDLDKSIAMLSKNSQMVADCKSRTGGKIDAFIKEYAYLLFEKKVHGFNSALCESLGNEIANSEDVDNVSKCINKYLEYVWGQFVADQEAWMKSVILKEISDVESIVNNDVKMLVGQMDIQSQRIIEEYLKAKYQVHSYIIGKEGKTDVGDLSKTMKIGSVVLVLFAPIAALLTFGGSELVKILFRGKIEEGKKDQLDSSAEKMSRQMAEQVLQQTQTQFDSIAEILIEQTMVVYDNILSELSEALSSKRINVSEIEEMLSIINTLEQTNH